MYSEAQIGAVAPMGATRWHLNTSQGSLDVDSAASIVNRKRNIRLGGWEPHVVAAATRSGMTISAWVRQAIAGKLQESLSKPAEEGRLRGFDPKPNSSKRHRCVLRVNGADLDRWKSEALEHELALTRYIELQMSVTPDRSHRIATAVEVVRRANVELAALGRNLNQLARSWNTYPGQSSARERALLLQHCADVDRLSAQFSHLTAELSARRGVRRRARP